MTNTDETTSTSIDAQVADGAEGVVVEPTEPVADEQVEAADHPGSDESESDESDEPGSDDPESDESDEADANDNPLEVEAEVAADYLEELLDIADLDGDIDTYVDGDRAHVSIVSNSDALVGRDGQVLDALQELARLAVLAETGQRSRLMLDVAGFREKRRNELLALVADAVEAVRDGGEPMHLKAMNPFERKIVHDAVAAAGLTSESEGEEPRRHVIVLPAGA